MVPFYDLFNWDGFSYLQRVNSAEKKGRVMLFKRVIVLLCVALCRICVASQPVQIDPGQPAILYTGRFTDDHRFGWSGSRIKTELKGSAISAVLELVSWNRQGITASLFRMSSLSIWVPMMPAHRAASRRSIKAIMSRLTRHSFPESVLWLRSQKLSSASGRWLMSR